MASAILCAIGFASCSALNTPGVHSSTSVQSRSSAALAASLNLSKRPKTTLRLAQWRENGLLSQPASEVLRYALKGVPLSLATRSACLGLGIPPTHRVFVADAISANARAYKQPGGNCESKAAPRRRKIRIVVLSTLNNAWLISPQETAPAEFFGTQSTHRVPMMHFYATLPASQSGGVSTVLVPFQYRRYALFLIQGVPQVSQALKIAQRASVRDRLDVFADPKHTLRVDLSVPVFAVRESSRTCIKNCPNARAEYSALNLFLRIGPDGAGLGQAVPASSLKFLPAANLSVNPITLRFDHPFYFAVLDYGAHTILFFGRVARPTLNA